MLAVRPDAQGRGLGGRLIAEAEAWAARAGASVMDIKVVNLRTDLLPRYARMGYVATGTEPYEHRPVLQPCHFILMEKGLRGPA
jgi:GNAT superfamily N-acetyltransferase